MTERTLKAAHPALRDDIGDLVTRRPVPGPRVEQVDPFLFLNHHGPQTYPPNNRGLPFGPHPHRGFETVTFILAGDLAHRDTGGHESIISEGGVQWMTAGSGLIHAEVSPEAFKRQGGPMEILQLWVNLPARLKMTAPSYHGVQKDEVPMVETEGATVNLVSGSYGGKTGPIQSLTGVFMTTIKLRPGGSVDFGGLKGRSVFLYVVDGAAQIGGRQLPAYHLADLSDGETLRLTSEAGATLLFGHADPIGEPVVAHGPFVMNTVQEIHAAFADYQAGKFGHMAA